MPQSEPDREHDEQPRKKYATKCKYYHSDGSPIGSGCLSSRCNFTHPNDPGWSWARESYAVPRPHFSEDRGRNDFDLDRGGRREYHSPPREDGRGWRDRYKEDERSRWGERTRTRSPYRRWSPHHARRSSSPPEHRHGRSPSRRRSRSRSRSSSGSRDSDRRRPHRLPPRRPLSPPPYQRRLSPPSPAPSHKRPRESPEEGTIEELTASKKQKGLHQEEQPSDADASSILSYGSSQPPAAPAALRGSQPRQIHVPSHAPPAAPQTSPTDPSLSSLVNQFGRTPLSFTLPPMQPSPLSATLSPTGRDSHLGPPRPRIIEEGELVSSPPSPTPVPKHKRPDPQVDQTPSPAVKTPTLNANAKGNARAGTRTQPVPVLIPTRPVPTPPRRTAALPAAQPEPASSADNGIVLPGTTQRAPPKEPVAKTPYRTPALVRKDSGKLVTSTAPRPPPGNTSNIDQNTAQARLSGTAAAPQTSQGGPASVAGTKDGTEGLYPNIFEQQVHTAHQKVSTEAPKLLVSADILRGILHRKINLVVTKLAEGVDARQRHSTLEGRVAQMERQTSAISHAAPMPTPPTDAATEKLQQGLRKAKEEAGKAQKLGDRCLETVGDALIELFTELNRETEQGQGFARDRLIKRQQEMEDEKIREREAAKEREQDLERLQSAEREVERLGTRVNKLFDEVVALKGDDRNLHSKVSEVDRAASAAIKAHEAETSLLLAGFEAKLAAMDQRLRERDEAGAARGAEHEALLTKLGAMESALQSRDSATPMQQEVEEIAERQRDIEGALQDRANDHVQLQALTNDALAEITRLDASYSELETHVRSLPELPSFDALYGAVRDRLQPHLSNSIRKAFAQSQVETETRTDELISGLWTRLEPVIELVDVVEKWVDQTAQQGEHGSAKP